jgi:hypothetical protein
LGINKQVLLLVENWISPTRNYIFYRIYLAFLGCLLVVYSFDTQED